MQNKIIKIERPTTDIVPFLIKKIIERASGNFSIIDSRVKNIRYQKLLEFLLPQDVFCIFNLSEYNINPMQQLHKLVKKRAKYIILHDLGMIDTNLPLISSYTDIAMELTIGGYVDNTLWRRLVEYGYTHVDTVRSIGEFATRGEVMDFSISELEGVRIHFCDNYIEKISIFDITNQLSKHVLQTFTIYPINTMCSVISKMEHLHFSQLFDIGNIIIPTEILENTDQKIFKPYAAGKEIYELTPFIDLESISIQA